MRRKGIEKDAVYWKKVKGQKKVKKLRKYYEALGYEVNSGEVEEEGVDMIVIMHEEKRIDILEITNWKRSSYAGYDYLFKCCENLVTVAKLLKKKYPSYLVEKTIVISYQENIDRKYDRLLISYRVSVDVDGECPLTEKDDIPKDFSIEWVD